MAKPKLTIVYADDWEGLYKDGVLVTEGHAVRVNDVAIALGHDIDYIEVCEDWMKDRGDLPPNLKEVRVS